MRVSIIVLAHDQLAMTRRCLRALAGALDGIDHEVVCVDNASIEDLGPIREEGRAFARFALERNDDNLSFSIANNRAAARTSGDWLLFVNNDVEVADGSIRALMAFIARHPGAAVCGARLVYPGGQQLQHAGMEQMLWGVASNYGVGASTADDRFRRETERFAVTGAMLCIRQDVFRAVGGFGEEYAWGYEDVDLCLKARQAGWQVWYVPGAEAVHAESVTLRARRRPEDTDRNYRIYRRQWDHALVPAESAYVNSLRDAGICKVVVFGTGAAGQALRRRLDAAGFVVAAFASTAPEQAEAFGLPLLAISDLSHIRYDRLVVGTQYYFELEAVLRSGDPHHAPLFPVLSSQRWPLERPLPIR